MGQPLPDSASSDAMRHSTEILCHVAFWYGPLFAVPVYIALRNPGDMMISLPLLAAGLLMLLLLTAGLTSGLAAALDSAQRITFATVLLACALVLAVQANVLHPLSYFGQFDGRVVNFRKFGWLFWLEWYGFLAGLILLPLLLSRFRQIPAWLPWIAILSFSLLWLPAAIGESARPVDDRRSGFDESVFDFSPVANLVHLLPDGLQSDVVEQVLSENPALANRFRGFTLYADHLGMYQGTAPALPTLLTGRPFEFERGHRYDWITPFIDRHSYQNVLASHGFTLDLVVIDQAYCVKRAKSCVVRPFSDWKSRGYDKRRNNDRLYSLKLLADLSLYRLLPAFLKEKIHKQGEWMLADSTLDGASPWPDPVIREWTERMRVGNKPAMYKWYHYIGTHKPPFWNKECVRISGLARSRASFLGQASCILEGIALLLEKLQHEGIYEQTAIIISGDHGHDIAPRDMNGPAQFISLSEKMMGTARPALLVKEMGSLAPLKISAAPTSLIDVAGMALSLVGIPADEFSQLTARIPADPGRKRYFYHYPVEKLARWSAQPIPYDLYQVNGPVTAEQSWELLNIQAEGPAPQQFPVISHRTASEFLRGTKLHPYDPDKETAWIIRKQLAFVLSIPDANAGNLQLILSMHVPDWVGDQSFEVRINDFELQQDFEIHPTRQFWQDVAIDIPLHALREGNNFISLKFEKFRTVPSNENLNAAGLLKSIHIKRTRRPG